MNIKKIIREILLFLFALSLAYMLLYYQAGILVYIISFIGAGFFMSYIRIKTKHLVEKDKK